MRERARGFPFATSGDRETVRQTRECTLQSRAKLQYVILRSAKCKGKCRLFKKKKANACRSECRSDHVMSGTVNCDLFFFEVYGEL